jgi:MFS family permease
MPPDSPDARKRRFVLVSATVALSLLGDTLLYAVLPARPEDFRVLVWQVGLLLGANRIIRLLTNELAGRMIRRYGSRIPLFAAVGLGSLVTAAYALRWGFWWLLAARMLWGACWSVLRVEGYLAALAFSSRGNRGRIFGLYQAITWTGAGGGVLVGGFLCDLLGISPTFALFGLLAAGGIALAAWAPPAEKQALPAPERPRAGALASGALASGAPLFLWFCAFALTMTEQMIGNLTGRLVVDRILPDMAGLNLALGAASLSGLLLSVRSLQTLILGPLAGLISDRVGRTRLLAAACLLQVVLIGGLALSRSWWLIILLLLLQFAAAVSARLLIIALAGDLAPPGDEALFMSRFSTFVDLGTALGPPAAFSLYAGLGFGYVAALAAGLLLPVLLPLAAGALRRKSNGA